MRRGLFWIGILVLGAGLAVLAVSLVMRSLGYEPSYNFGDPTKFEFVLIPLWQAGLGIVLLGGVLFLGSRLLGRTP